MPQQVEGRAIVVSFVRKDIKNPSPGDHLPIASRPQHVEAADDFEIAAGASLTGTERTPAIAEAKHGESAAAVKSSSTI